LEGGTDQCNYRNIKWKFYLVFIIPGTIGALIMFFFFPDTKGLPLEEIAAIFGDSDEVAIYQREIEIDHHDHTLVIHTHDGRLEEEKQSEPITRENIADGSQLE
jgi:hypothetical protein